MTTPCPAELLGRIPDRARHRRYFPALLLFAADYGGYLLCVAGAVVLPGWWVKALCVVAAALLIGGLYVIGHDAGHGVFVPGRRANRWIARGAFAPAYAPLAAWFRAHVLLHHNFLRVRGRDMVWMPWTLDEYRSASRWRRAWYRFLRTPVGVSFYWTVGNWVPYLLFPPRAELGERRGQHWFDRLLVLGFAATLFGALYVLARVAAGWSWADPVGPVGILFLGLIGPYLGWTYLIGVVDLVQHTHPRAVWFASRDEWDYATANLRSTTHMVLPFELNRLTHNILDHTAHHVDPRVPLYNLREAQTALEAAYPDDVPVERFTPRYVLRLLRTCRLYDYGRQQWLDYDGTPTAPAQRPAPPAPAPEPSPAAAEARS
jgi:omega-6 fatty acid desaturase (delta-12 desaturase)